MMGSREMLFQIERSLSVKRVESKITEICIE